MGKLNTNNWQHNTTQKRQIALIKIIVYRKIHFIRCLRDTSRCRFKVDSDLQIRALLLQRLIFVKEDWTQAVLVISLKKPFKGKLCGLRGIW